ncbi:MAG TPA: iron-sulfur cluster assembly scaffold protein [Phycisphaerae bacterium]|nr:iron-sulfur cluster assembly scaffold protein [Phycisphaerae bacterium]
MYSDKVIELFDNPLNMGSLDKDDPAVGTGVVGSPECGDVMKLQIKVGADGKVEDVKFKTFGCAAAVAASSLATEWLKGKTLEEAETISNKTLADQLSLPAVKMHCSVLAEGAVRAAIEDWKKKRQGVVEKKEDPFRD